MLTETDQASLLRELRAGSREAWDRVYRLHFAAVWKYASRLLGSDRETVADVVQEAFLAAARSIRQFDESRGTLAAWLCGLTHHQVSRAWRRQQQARRLQVVAIEQCEVWSNWFRSDDFTLAAEQHELAEFVRDVLAELPADQAWVLTGRYLDGRSTDDLAREWGCSMEAMKSRLARAWRDFRDRFESIVKSRQSAISP